MAFARMGLHGVCTGALEQTISKLVHDVCAQGPAASVCRCSIGEMPGIDFTALALTRSSMRLFPNIISQMRPQA
jgi:hypothetical protein